MAGHDWDMFGWSWIEVSVLGSQVFGRASMEGCVVYRLGPFLVEPGCYLPPDL